jgi:hypothetical protein
VSKESNLDGPHDVDNNFLSASDMLHSNKKGMFKNNSNRDGEKQEASVVQGFEIGREGWEIED